ncbi:female sterile (1) Nasrat [Carabus blaptoides fortunei]
MFKIWNSTERRYDIILIAALVGENFDMHWYRIKDDNNLEKIWWWHLHKRVSHLKVFEAGDYSKLLIISKGQNDSESFDDLVKNCARRSQRNIITGRKTFKNAKVENITFTTINDIAAEKVAYKSGDTLRVKGDLTFTNSLRVTGNVELFEGGTFNDMILKDELVYMDSDVTYENLQFEDLQVELVNSVKYINKEEIHFSMVYENIDETTAGTLVLDSLDLSNIKVTTQFINGQDFDTFKNNMCKKDADYYFPGNTTIIGRVHVQGTADIKTLNGLKYPEEYLIAKKSGFTRITGKKIFTGNVSTLEVVANGLVDGIDLNTIITCSLNQTIPGNFTFSSLEISESLSVNGSIIIGENNEKFIPNPTLEDTHTLNANVIFSNLQVDGVVTVSNKIGNLTINQIFENVVYKDEERVTINAQKEFTNSIRVKHNLEIESNSINDNDINDFITLDTEQVIDANTITGNITIDNLDIDGLVNGENYTELLNDLIRLDRDEDIDAEIIFENTEDVPDIVASELYINNINDLSSEDLVWTTGDRVFGEDVHFDNVKAEHADILKDFEYEIECFDINEYDENRLSLTRDQTITGKYKIESGHVDKIETAKINDYEWDFIKHFVNVDELLYEKLTSGQLRIGELHVKDSLNIESLNEYNLEELFQNAFWIDRSNNISTEVVFENDVMIEHLNIKNLNGENFKHFLADLVLKNETNVVFNGHKTFTNGFKVESLNVDQINDVIVDDILLKSEEQNILGNVFIHGDVWVHDDLDVKHYINNVSIDFLKEHYKFEDDTCILKGK